MPIKAADLNIARKDLKNFIRGMGIVRKKPGRSEEKELIGGIIKTNSPKLVQKLIFSHMDIIVEIGTRYYAKYKAGYYPGCVLKISDIITAGNFGLLMAACSLKKKKFKWSFRKFAKIFVEGEILDTILMQVEVLMYNKAH